MPPFLSIITITRNDALGLTATLTSTAPLREWMGIEHIVIDGNDPGASPVVVASGVQVVRREPRGVADAFNIGVAAASGEWLWFLNGGDMMHPEVDFEFVTRALALTKADAVIFNIEREDGITYRPSLAEIWPPIFNWIPHPATLVRAQILRDAGGFSTAFRIAADMDLWFRLFSRNAAVDLIDHKVAWFAAGGISSTNVARLWQENIRILWAHRGHIGYHLARQNLLVPYAIAVAATTVLFGHCPRWLARPFHHR